MFTPTLRCECAQPASDRLMRKWCIHHFTSEVQIHEKNMIANYWNSSDFTRKTTDFIMGYYRKYPTPLEGTRIQDYFLLLTTWNYSFSTYRGCWNSGLFLHNHTWNSRLFFLLLTTWNPSFAGIPDFFFFYSWVPRGCWNSRLLSE